MIAVSNVSQSWNDVRPTITFDSSNNMYMYGVFNKSSFISILNADGSTSSYTNPNVSGNFSNLVVYLAKFNSTGTAQWVACPAVRHQTANVVTDSAGNIYIAGYYFIGARGATNYDAGGSTSSIVMPDVFDANASPNSVMDSAAALLKYNSSGVLQFIAAIDIINSREIDVGLGINSSNELFVIAQLQSSSTQVPRIYNGDGQLNTNIQVTAPQYTDGSVLYVKYNTSGVAQWAGLIDHYCPNNYWSPNPTFTTTGNLIITGAYTWMDNDASPVFYDDPQNPGQASSNNMIPVWDWPGRSRAVFMAAFNRTTGRLTWVDSFASGADGGPIIHESLASKVSNALYTIVEGDSSVLTVDFVDGSTIPKPPISRYVFRNLIG